MKRSIEGATGSQSPILLCLIAICHGQGAVRTQSSQLVIETLKQSGCIIVMTGSSQIGTQQYNHIHGVIAQFLLMIAQQIRKNDTC